MHLDYKTSNLDPTSQLWNVKQAHTLSVVRVFLLRYLSEQI